MPKGAWRLRWTGAHEHGSQGKGHWGTISDLNLKTVGLKSLSISLTFLLMRLSMLQSKAKMKKKVTQRSFQSYKHPLTLHSCARTPSINTDTGISSDSDSVIEIPPAQHLQYPQQPVQNPQSYSLGYRPVANMYGGGPGFYGHNSGSASPPVAPALAMSPPKSVQQRGHTGRNAGSAPQATLKAVMVSQKPVKEPARFIPGAAQYPGTPSGQMPSLSPWWYGGFPPIHPAQQ